MKSYSEKYREELKKLPTYCCWFFDEYEDLAVSTRYAYATDLKIFFEWIKCRENLEKASDVTIEMLDELTYEDLTRFKNDVSDNYTFTGSNRTNNAHGLARKIATLRKFFFFMAERKYIKIDPTGLLKIPKIPETEIVILSEDEQQKLFNVVENGHENASKKKQTYHEKTVMRNLAILSLFLGTGIRVSELVGINDTELNLEEQSVNVFRKGGKWETVYYSEEVRDTIWNYMQSERKILLGYSPSDEVPEDLPLFVSLKKQRITTRMVEIIVKEYAKDVVKGHTKITPHTLRKTYGSYLYYQYKDIYLAQKALGHSSSQTTIKYYTKFNKDYLEELKNFNPKGLK